ncbi:hypothetical protein ACFZAR_38415 [Streptomyces sp. NPDC008222]|uniref:hypothetical protein n=1 Tax=Streptomyces sp. NPDC008222 TaxID=3364820 RepID=UPI0036F18DEF
MLGKGAGDFSCISREKGSIALRGWWCTTSLALTDLVAGNRDDNVEGLALDPTGVLLDEAVVAVVAGEGEVLELVQFAGG